MHAYSRCHCGDTCHFPGNNVYLGGSKQSQTLLNFSNLSKSLLIPGFYFLVLLSLPSPNGCSLCCCEHLHLPVGASVRGGYICGGCPATRKYGQRVAYQIFFGCL